MPISIIANVKQFRACVYDGKYLCYYIYIDIR